MTQMRVGFADRLQFLASNQQVLFPGENAAHFYFSTHTSEKQEWLLSMTQNQWPVSFFNYEILLLGVMRKPLMPEIGTHPKLDFVLMDQNVKVY